MFVAPCVNSHDSTWNRSFRAATGGHPGAAQQPSYDAETLSCATPIYDALYREHRRLFRAVPGDRSGEESPRCAAFPYPCQERSEPPVLPQQQSRRTADHPWGARPVVPVQSAGHVHNGQAWGVTRADGPPTLLAPSDRPEGQ